MKNVKVLLLAAACSFFSLPVKSQDKQEAKLDRSLEVLTEFSRLKENIPQQLFEIAEGIVIVPRLINAGLGVAGKRGTGIAVIKNANESWSNPVFVSLTGGSFGLQAGVQSVDLVLIFKSRETLSGIGKNSFTLGGDVSVTAGPLGRNSTASTDARLEAEVYSYSKARGVFAGISLSGSVLDISEKANTSFYGKPVDAQTIFEGGKQFTSPETKALKRKLSDLFDERPIVIKSRKVSR
jgi:lipid-binding SYLF domain-containing protein